MKDLSQQAASVDVGKWMLDNRHAERHVPKRYERENPMIEFVCPKCSSAMNAPEDQIGEVEECLHCGQRMTVPPSSIVSQDVWSSSAGGAT